MVEDNFPTCSLGRLIHTFLGPKYVTLMFITVQ